MRNLLFLFLTTQLFAQSFPLERVHVTGSITGMVAYITVEQTFRNDTTEPVEAEYTFPLPENAAVHEMMLRIGNRLITSEVHEKKTARKIYEEAKKQGRKTGLLEQHRPNIFTQKVANIEPGESIEVILRYFQTLPYNNGTYSFYFPTTVGPRFIPGKPVGRTGSGFSPDTDRVPDASRITPKVIPHEEPPAATFSLEITVEAGFPILELATPNFEPLIRWENDQKVFIQTQWEERPNRDFMVTYTVAGPDVQTKLFISQKEGEDEGTFLLILQPPAETAGEELPKEIYFVMDCSGSMAGWPLKVVKKIVHTFLQNLNPEDTFQIIRFSNTSTAFSPTPLPATPENVQRGHDYVDAAYGGGGTYMLKGVLKALSPPYDPQRPRIVFFLTDGYIGNEREILANIRKNRRDAHIIAVGIGSSPNRYLMEEMAREGHGFSFYVSSENQLDEKLPSILQQVHAPIWDKVSIQWEGLHVEDVYPEEIPPLFPNQPVTVLGRFHGNLQGALLLQGRKKEENFTYSIPFLPKGVEHKAIALLWAREKIRVLTHLNLEKEDPGIRQEVIQLAKHYHLMSRYTSFVAVEKELPPVLSSSPLKTLVQPGHLPQNMEAKFVRDAVLSLQNFKPGDPILYVKAPPEAMHVLAVFPFSQVLPLSYDVENDIWYTHFLVPEDTQEGTYSLIVRIILPEGDWIERVVPFTVDASPPEFQLDIIQDGQKLLFTASPKGWREEMAEKAAFILPDLLTLYLQFPDGNNLVLKRDKKNKKPLWKAWIALPSGHYELRLIAIDTAQNLSLQKFAISVP